MIKGNLDGKTIFYWQTDKNVPQKGDRITYEDHVYEVQYRHFAGADIHLISKELHEQPE